MGALRKRLIDKVKSGHAQATSALLRLWLNDDTESGMELRLFGGKTVRVQLRHSGYFLSDAEAQGLLSMFEELLASSLAFDVRTLLLKVTVSWTTLVFFRRLIAPSTIN